MNELSPQEKNVVYLALVARASKQREIHEETNDPYWLRELVITRDTLMKIFGMTPDALEYYIGKQINPPFIIVGGTH